MISLVLYILLNIPGYVQIKTENSKSLMVMEGQEVRKEAKT